MSNLQEIALVAIGILLLIGIGVLIARDARRRAPVADPDHPDGLDHHRRSGVQRKKDRARAQAARRARRNNRH
ncbi:hypothetical protein [Capillimicrobium parvum]|uniref:Uncharacterized protein n=1 Tax=Capillimicrobium parvum TaxID=2884022 RepID=A0A9E7C1I6_9ACTN|nr:hypothetical protein [Capillimicrobium parvum]UGS36642.1 hypothetical protein DSM104329_03050 [Capillimicrobium parvum]